MLDMRTKNCSCCKAAKVRHHCHFTGEYRGAAHKSCNLKIKIQPGKTKIPVVFHNLRSYDSHLIMQQIHRAKGNITCIPNSTEKYLSFGLGQLKKYFSKLIHHKRINLLRLQLRCRLYNRLLLHDALQRSRMMLLRLHLCNINRSIKKTYKCLYQLLLRYKVECSFCKQLFLMYLHASMQVFRSAVTFCEARHLASAPFYQQLLF